MKELRLSSIYWSAAIPFSIKTNMEEMKVNTQKKFLKVLSMLTIILLIATIFIPGNGNRNAVAKYRNPWHPAAISFHTSS